MKLLTSAPLALAALFLAATLPIHAEELPAGPKAGEQVWTPLYKDTLDDFRTKKLYGLNENQTS